VRRVVLDFIWRKKWSYVAGLAALSFWVSSWQSSGHRGIEGFSFYLFLFMHVFVTNTNARLEMKMALFVLPISGKQRERGLWCLGVVVPALIGLAARCLAAGVGILTSEPATVDWSWIAFAAFFDGVFIGALLSPWAVSSPFVANLNSARALKLFLHLCLVCAPFAGMWALVKYLPAGWDQMNTWTWLALVAGLGMTAVGYRQSLRLEMLGGLYKRPVGLAISIPDVAPTRKPFGDRLSSVQRTLWTQFKVATVSAVVLIVVVGLFEASFSGRWNIVSSLRRLVPLADFSRFPAMPLLLVGFLTTASISTRALQIAIRALRALPLKTWELNALLIARLAVTWFGFWLVLVLADLALGGRTPESSSAEVFVGLFGVTCLVNAVALKWQSPASLVVAAAIAGLTLGLGSVIGGSRVIEGRLHLDGRFLHTAAVAGIVCLIAAAYWNHRLLTRSSVIYKRTTLFPESA